MKQLFIVALLFLTAFAFGSSPIYDVGENDVGVYVQNDIEKTISLAATVDLKTGDVVHSKDASQLNVVVKTSTTQNGHLAILTELEQCRYLYIAEFSNSKQTAYKNKAFKQNYHHTLTSQFFTAAGGMPFRC